MMHLLRDEQGTPHTGRDLARLLGFVLKRNVLLRTLAAALELAHPEPAPIQKPPPVPRRCSIASGPSPRAA